MDDRGGRPPALAPPESRPGGGQGDAAEEAIADALRPAGAGRGLPIPWWAKIAAKLVLARLPVGYRGWASLGVFRHGRADRDPAQCIAATDAALGAWARHHPAGAAPPRTTLELGPGDSVATALVAAARGVQRPMLMDVGDFATREMDHYRQVAAALAERATPLPGPLGPDRAAMLAGINARYLTGGTASLAELADGSVDLAWSTSVVEHVRLAEVPRFLAELFRVTAPGGMGWHSIDLMDHLGGGLENLRFGEALWEAPWFAARSGFYTNRLRAAELVALSRAAGFRARIAWRQWWPALPLPKARMAAHFRAMPEDELRIAGIQLVLEKPAPPDDAGPGSRP